MLIGLTGGIASGKSTFRNLLGKKHNFVTFDADRCVHELLAADKDVIAAICARFGDAVIAPNGSIDRPALRRIVFADTQQRKSLEQIIHPVVRSRWREQRQSCLEQKKDFLADIPLLFETHAQCYFDTTILVAASHSNQMQRLAVRGLSAETAQAMLASQSPISEKVKHASVVIWNDGAISELEHQARLLIESLFPLPS